MASRAEQFSSVAPFPHLGHTTHMTLEYETTGTDQRTWKAQMKYSFFIPPLAPTKVFLNEGKLNNFSKKVLIYYILQLDRPQPRPVGFTWTHQQFYMSKCLGECLHTPQVTLARFQTAQCLSFQFYQRSSSSFCPLLSWWKWTLQKYTSTVLPPGSWGAYIILRAQAGAQSGDISILLRWCDAFFIKRTPACQENPTNGFWINHN